MVFAMSRTLDLSMLIFRQFTNDVLTLDTNI